MQRNSIPETEKSDADIIRLLQNLSSDDADNLSDSLLETNRKLVRNTEHIMRNLKAIEELITCNVPSKHSENALEIKELFARTNALFASAKRSLESSPINGKIWDDEQAIRKIHSELTEKTLGYSCFFSEKSIDICMPMLPARTLKIFGKYDIKGYDSHLGDLLFNILTEKKISSPGWKTEANFSFKTIHFFFLYNSEQGILDSDNHDTKNVQDVICNLFRTGDYAQTTQTFFTTIVSKTLPEKTYIHIAPMSEPVWKSSNLQNYWKEKIEVKYENPPHAL